MADLHHYILTCGIISSTARAAIRTAECRRLAAVGSVVTVGRLTDIPNNTVVWVGLLP
jgi:hypothetical protein